MSAYFGQIRLSEVIRSAQGQPFATLILKPFLTICLTNQSQCQKIDNLILFGSTHNYVFRLGTFLQPLTRNPIYKMSSFCASELAELFPSKI